MELKTINTATGEVNTSTIIPIDEALILLAAIHDATPEDADSAPAGYAPCNKCNGKGYIHAFDHVAGGVCFRCAGNRWMKIRKPSKAQVEKEEIRKAREIENNRKLDAAMAQYANDSRLRVSTSHPYYYAHAMELAKKDGVWETL